MLLIISNSQDATADYLAQRLDASDGHYIRFDTDTLLKKEISFSYAQREPLLKIANQSYGPDDFANVWYRRPERLRSSKEEETPETTYGLKEWTEVLEGYFAHIE